MVREFPVGLFRLPKFEAEASISPCIATPSTSRRVPSGLCKKFKRLFEGIIKGDADNRKDPRIVNFFGLLDFGVFAVSIRITFRDFEVGEGDKELISMDLREVESRIFGLEERGREGLEGSF